jgi:hypothetical protein
MRCVHCGWQAQAGTELAILSTRRKRSRTGITLKNRRRYHQDHRKRLHPLCARRTGHFWGRTHEHDPGMWPKAPRKATRVPLGCQLPGREWWKPKGAAARLRLQKIGEAGKGSSECICFPASMRGQVKRCEQPRPKTRFQKFIASPLRCDFSTYRTNG